LIAKLRRQPQATLDGTSVAADTEKELEELCLSCTSIAEEILARFKSSEFRSRLAIKGVEMSRVSKAWQSLGAAIADAWSQDERLALVKRLSVLREAIETHIVVELR